MSAAMARIPSMWVKRPGLGCILKTQPSGQENRTATPKTRAIVTDVVFIFILQCVLSARPVTDITSVERISKAALTLFP